MKLTQLTVERLVERDTLSLNSKSDQKFFYNPMNLANLSIRNPAIATASHAKVDFRETTVPENTLAPRAFVEGISLSSRTNHEALSH